MTFFVAGAVVVGAGISAYSSHQASKQQADAQRRAARTQGDFFNRINEQEQPYIQSGYGAQNALNYLLGTAGPGGMDSAGGLTPGASSNHSDRDLFRQRVFNAANPSASTDAAGGINPTAGSDFGAATGLGAGYLTHQFDTQDFYNNLDPGYQFQLQQGQQAVRNASTPGVGALSGPALKQLMSFNQGLAGTSYQNAFNRYTQQQNNIFGRLSAIAGLGQNAASQVGTQGTALGQGIAQAQAAAGASQAAGTVGVGNSLSSGIQLAGLLNNSNSAYGGQAPQQATLAGAAGEASS